MNSHPSQKQPCGGKGKSRQMGQMTMQKNVFSWISFKMLFDYSTSKYLNVSIPVVSNSIIDCIWYRLMMVDDYITTTYSRTVLAAEIQHRPKGPSLSTKATVKCWQRLALFTKEPCRIEISWHDTRDERNWKKHIHERNNYLCFKVVLKLHHSWLSLLSLFVCSFYGLALARSLWPLPFSAVWVEVCFLWNSTVTTRNSIQNYELGMFKVQSL